MRIFYAPPTELVILDSVAELHLLYKAAANFLESTAPEVTFKALTSGSPAPYSEFLPYLRIRKWHGLVYAEIDSARGLCVSGPKDSLSTYIKAFLCECDHDHQHPELQFSDQKGQFQEDSFYPSIQADDQYEEQGFSYNA